MYYKYHKINFQREGLRIDSTNWIKKKKAKINQKNYNNKCFQYVATVTLNHEDIKRDQKRISKVKCFINKYNWNGITYTWKIDH